VKGRTALIVLAAAGAVSTVGPTAQAMPASPNVISGAPASIAIGYGSYSAPTTDIFYVHARGLPDSGTVTWFFDNPAGLGDMSATDSTGLNLYDTGQHHSPHTFSFVWKWAGTYPFHSTTTGTKGTVKVLMVRSPARGALGTSFVLKWASALRAGCAFDVEVKKPGVPWTYLRFGTTLMSYAYRPTVKGWYAIRSRLRNTTNNKASGFSPVVLLDVT
jgi:hypothetical protein